MASEKKDDAARPAASTAPKPPSGQTNKLVKQPATMDPTKRTPKAARTAIEKGLVDTKAQLEALDALMKQVLAASKGVDTSIGTSEGDAYNSFVDATIELNNAMMHRIPPPAPV